MKNIFCLFLVLLSQPAFAAERPQDEQLNEVVDVAAGYPLTIDDERAEDLHHLAVQTSFHFDHQGVDGDTFTVEPQIQYGLFKDVELNIGLPYRLQERDDNHGDNLDIGLKYNFVEEQANIPGLAIEQEVTMPTANNSAGHDLTTHLFVTKHVLPQFGVTALYFNANWTRFAKVDEDERRNAFAAAIGLSHALNDKTALVADFVEEEEDEKGQSEALAELGFRRAMSDDLVLSMGGGLGLNKDPGNLY